MTGEARIPTFEADPGVDPMRLARLLGRAHRLAVKRGRVPSILRPVVSGSWSRSASAGIDPDGSAPKLLSERETRSALRTHPLAEALLGVGTLLDGSLEAGCLVALADERGLLLWADGDSATIEAAGGSGFLPGHLCSEEAVGTNAVGTAIAVDGPVQIFAAEHYSRRLHWLSCAAAPIRDPETGRLIGVINISADFRRSHPHTLGLVRALAQILEGGVERRARDQDELLRAAYTEWIAANRTGHSALIDAAGRVIAASPAGWLGSTVRVRRDGNMALPEGVRVARRDLGGCTGVLIVSGERDQGGSGAERCPLAIEVESQRLVVSRGGWRSTLTRRQSQVLLHLALAHPGGLATDELGPAVYGDGWKPVTLRAEVSRLRNLLGPVIGANPYRLLVPVEVDRDALGAAA